MSTQTTNLGLIKDDESEFYNVGRVNDNLDKIDAAIGDNSEMKVAGGTGTVITLSIPSITAYKTHQKITFIASANNAGNTTTINVNGLGAKNLYKPNTTTAPNLISGKAYEVWYDSSNDCFFLKASAEGNAIAATVLAGKTFSNDDDSGITGTMVNHGSIGTVNLTNEGSEYLISEGYHNGLGKVKALITGLVANVIKAGTSIGGILGTFTSDATVTAGELLSGKTAYVNGNKVTGTIPSKGASTITPGTTNQTITSGQYLSGTQTILGDADLVSGNIKSGANIFGVAGNSNVVDTSSGNLVAGAILSGYNGYSDGNLVAGTMPDNYSNDNIVATTEVSGNTLKMNIPQTARYRSGYHLQTTDNAWVESNIKKGVSIFGKAGTYDNSPNPQAGSILLWKLSSQANYIFSTYSTTYTPVTSVVGGTAPIIAYSGVYRIAFMLRNQSTYVSYAQIYINGVPRGIERNAVNWTIFTEDIALNAGDSLDIFFKTTDGSRTAMLDRITISTNLNPPISHPDPYY